MNKKKLINKSIFLIFLAFAFIIFTGGVFGVGSYPAVDPNMVLYYHFNNDSAIGENDTFVVDSSGNVNATTNASFTLSSGILEDGFINFNGYSSFATATKKYDTLGNNVTFSMWINVNNKTWRGAILGGTSGSGPIFRIDSTNFQFYPNGVYASNFNGLINQTNTWYFITLVFTNETTINNVKIYVNGLLAGTTNNVANLTGENIIIGRRATVDYFNGSIDDLIIYNKTLTANEIWLNYHNYLSCINITSINTHIRDNTKICEGNKFINGTRVIIIDTNNSYINFTGSFFKGNGTNTNFALLSGLYNITFDGVNATDYNHIINLDRVNGFTLKNSWINNHFNTYALVDNGKNIRIENNTFGFGAGVPTNDSSFASVGGLYFRYSGINISIFNNNIRGCVYGACIRFLNLTISSNVTVAHNTLLGNASKLIEIASSSNILIQNNTLNDSNNNADSYNVGIHLMGYLNESFPNNITILDNRILNIGCAGILVQGGSFIWILNNTISHNSTFSINQCSNCAYEPITGISMFGIWKTWTSDGEEQSSQEVDYIRRYNSRNVTITGNNITGFPVLLKIAEPVNLVHDFVNYWFRSFSSIDNIEPRIDYFISDNFNNASTTFNLTYGNPVVISYLLGQKYPGYSTNTPFVSFSIFKDYLYFKNNNYTEGYNGTYDIYNGTWTTEIYNQTNSLVYNTNGTPACTDINSCDGNINFTMSPFNETYVLENFNLTEGVSRLYSPIWFSSSSATEKHIASNLTNTVNASVIFPVTSCDYVGKITYTSDTGAYSLTFNNGEYTCSGGKVTLTLPIERATASNVILISYNQALQEICDESDQTFLDSVVLVGMIMTMILIAGALSIFFLSFYGFIDFRMDFGDIGIKEIAAAVLIIGITGLIIATMTYLIGDSYCTALGA